MGVSSRPFFLACGNCLMNLLPIADLNDPRLAPYRDLQREAVRRRAELFIAEGKLVVQRLLASDYEVVSVVAEPARTACIATLVVPEVPVFVVSPSQIRELTGFDFHRGLLACGRRKPLLAAERLFATASEGEVAVAAIGIDDLENLGSLIRSATAMGVSDMVLSRQTIDPLCRRVLRVSMGAALKMRYYDLPDPLAWLNENEGRGGWTTIATTLAPDSVPLSELTQRPGFNARRRMIVLGNEYTGLPAPLQNACSFRATIPMAPGVDSLNVAVAGAITIYELLRSSPPNPLASSGPTATHRVS